MALSRSPNVLAALDELGLKTPLDVLECLPKRFESFIYTKSKNGDYADKERIVILGKVRGDIKTLRFSSRAISRFYFETIEGETFLVEAWNRPYLGKSVDANELYTISGSFDAKRHALSLLNILKGRITPEESLRPLYRLPMPLSDKTYRQLVSKCLLIKEGKIENVIPDDLRRKYRLIDRETAFRYAHFPHNPEELHQAMRLFKYEEALSFELRTQMVRMANQGLSKHRRTMIDKDKFAAFIAMLPYPLTSDQQRAINEAIDDMNGDTLMYRLLEGDVGSGKTLVASLLCYASYLRGEQAAFMAPTDALARQHYGTLQKLFAGTKINVVLLLGKMSGVNKHLAMNDAMDGTGDIFVGTHSLFSKKVNYSNLGLAIIDEQHKFGVNQRTMLLDKGEHTDLLMMSATPIPRTLTMTVYGDLDVSFLRQFPFGKRKVQVRKPRNAKELSMAINNSLQEKRRVYVVVPEIEPKEGKKNASVKEIYESYRKIYGEKATMMHGGMDEESKQVAMAAFSSGLCPILVATSLIEVGVDVPSANLMIIYRPSNFSLSSLHQLRGRIGRDGKEAYCYLVPESGLSEEAQEKLEVFAKEDDGFKIAEEDLKLRGPGEIGGLRQSGLPSFNYANIVEDYRIFEVARGDAIEMLKKRESKEIVEKIAGMKQTYRS